MPLYALLVLIPSLINILSPTFDVVIVTPSTVNVFAVASNPPCPSLNVIVVFVTEFAVRFVVVATLHASFTCNPSATEST